LSLSGSRHVDIHPTTSAGELARWRCRLSMIASAPACVEVCTVRLVAVIHIALHGGSEAELKLAIAAAARSRDPTRDVGNDGQHASDDGEHGATRGALAFAQCRR
jgi:hypothetical protein